MTPTKDNVQEMTVAPYVLCFAPWMVNAIVLDTILLWGVIAKGWSPAVESVNVASLPGDPTRKYFLLYVPVLWVFVLA